MDEPLTISVALPTIKHLWNSNKENAFLQQRKLCLMTWCSFLGLTMMFSMFHNIQLTPNIECKRDAFHWWNWKPGSLVGLDTLYLRPPPPAQIHSLTSQPGFLSWRLISKDSVNCSPFCLWSPVGLDQL